MVTMIQPVTPDSSRDELIAALHDLNDIAKRTPTRDALSELNEAHKILHDNMNALVTTLVGH